MEQNTSVSLENYLENFVGDNVFSGRYKNASKVIRPGLRLLEEEENRIQILKTTIKKKLDSGVVKNFDANEKLKKLKAKKSQNVQL